ncbi:MAG: GHKL domain-containing protein [Fimbriimonadaceae bacterium]|nr:GHKL domain-containing protein [Fimbriimonadaceae bacterium]QYK55240.1 MAG: GHKL domain-containing protein [Fimbriimonadaceae bacterium]
MKYQGPRLQDREGRLLLFSTLVSGVLLIGILALTWSNHAAVVRLATTDVELERTAKDILRLDEALTMTARMAALTSDPVWTNRYDRLETELDGSIARIFELASPKEREQIRTTIEANRALVALERRAIDLAQRGKSGEAYRQVFGPEYDRLKNQYLSGVQASLNLVAQRTESQVIASFAWATTVSIGSTLGLALSLLVLANGRRVSRRETRLRQELSLLTRQNTVERLAVGLAHELNQPLAAIVHYADAALKTLEDEGDRDIVRQALEGVSLQAQRAGQIVNRVRSYSKPSARPPERIDLRDVLRAALWLLQPEAESSRVALRQDLGGPVTVRGDVVQLQQVFVNLVLNGIEACQDLGGAGVVHVQIRAETGHVLATVRDNGTGIDETRLASLFEALESTKSGGLGLGLAIAREIVEGHGGRIEVSRSDGTTAFVVRLPREA